MNAISVVDILKINQNERRFHRKTLFFGSLQHKTVVTLFVLQMTGKQKPNHAAQYTQLENELTESSPVEPLLQELESEANFGKFFCFLTCLFPGNKTIKHQDVPSKA